MKRLLRWIAALLAIGSDARPSRDVEDALYDLRHRSARYY